MLRIYKPYFLWEDYINGMYNTHNVDSSELINKAVELLKDEKLFFETSLKVLDNWIVSTDVNLSNTNCNRRAWIGQSSCCYKYGVNEISTRKAWSLLNESERDKANLIADKIIRIYEGKYKEIHFGLGNKMLL